MSLLFLPGQTSVVKFKYLIAVSGTVRPRVTSNHCSGPTGTTHFHLLTDITGCITYLSIPNLAIISKVNLLFLKQKESHLGYFFSSLVSVMKAVSQKNEDLVFLLHSSNISLLWVYIDFSTDRQYLVFLGYVIFPPSSTYSTYHTLCLFTSLLSVSPYYYVNS